MYTVLNQDTHLKRIEHMQEPLNLLSQFLCTENITLETVNVGSEARLNAL